MATSTMQEQDQGLQESAQYAQERHPACHVIDEHIAAHLRASHAHGMITGIRQVLHHLEALTVGEREPEQERPNMPSALRAYAARRRCSAMSRAGPMA